MNTSHSLVIIISAILIVACQTSIVWLKDGGTPQDLDHDNYQCLEEAQEQISETYISFNGGATTEDVSVTNEPLFNACMEARGWRKNKPEKELNEKEETKINPKTNRVY